MSITIKTVQKKSGLKKACRYEIIILMYYVTYFYFI